jgi:hypothetical protein
MKSEPRRQFAVSRTRSYSGNEHTERVYTVCELSVGGCLITGMHFVVLSPPLPPRKVVQARVKAVEKKKEILELLMVFYFTYFNSERDLIFDTFLTRTMKPDEWK